MERASFATGGEKRWTAVGEDPPGSKRTQELTKQYRVVAVVGLSKDPSKESHSVAQYLIQNGFKVIPVNPTADEILGLRVYPSLIDIPDELARTVEIVDIFRPSEAVPPFVEQAVALRRKFGTHPKVVWMQLGIANEQAAELAKKAGMEVVQNKCIRIEHRMAAHG
jgi:predicted CoA-binding protein